MIKFILLTILSIICVHSIPQQQQQPQQQDFERVVQSIFNTSRSSGFNQIVLPEPLGPTEEPQIFIKDNVQCRCVPYHRCDPRNNTVINDSPDGNTNEDEQIDGFGLLDIRFDSQSCQDVLDVCCGYEKISEKPLPVKPVVTQPTRPTGCGIRNVGGIDFQITGNTMNEAGFGEFPWTLAILKNADESCVCGASLIHPQVVLTANHCVRKMVNNPGSLKVRAGEWDTQTTKERLPYQERVVRNIISHPQYDIRTLGNDIALLVLQTPFTLDDHIGVVCLPPASSVPSSSNCYASGWGKDIFGKQGKYSVIMKRIPLPIVSFDTCQNELRKTRLGNTFQLHPTFVCAGGVEGVDTCEGDGGAPLVCPAGNPADNRYAQNGIVAWGIGCNEARPAVYANVALARQWIDTQVRGLGFDPSVYSY
ncbi:phenoloxidase-activating factor 2 [Condylostylus longicornis]|uniref:phenoloxidase-activating factor 2 n=1 Tax=Condylostylus longicornis TaxID=2530218 RepID=UPI00244E5572|nr:phenoloxidase-activating factor 2 [Condylostylus longicornis]